MAIPHINTMLPIGRTATERQGDWIITWEVCGWNERLQVNVWQEKKHQYKPLPSISEAIKAIEANRDWEHAKMMHKRITD